MKIKEITSEAMASYKVVKTGPEGVTLQSPDMHTTLQLDPEAAKGIVQNPANPNQFTMNKDAAMGTANTMGSPEQGLKQGSEVEITATENTGAGKTHSYSYETSAMIPNPDFNAEDENSPEEIDVTIEYDIYGSYVPARIRYDDYDHPAEYPEIDGYRVINTETGEDITDRVDGDQIEKAIWDAEDDREPDDDYYEEEVGGDPTDDFIDDVEDKEFGQQNESDELSHIRKLSGL